MRTRIEKKATAEERLLQERFIAGDRAAETEVVTRLGKHGRKISARRWGWREADWREHWGEFALLAYRYRDQGKVRVDRPLIQLARRLIKQVWRKEDDEAERDKSVLRWGGGPEDDDGWDDRLEAEAQSAPSAQPRFKRADVVAERKEGLEQARAALSATDRATLEAELAVERGEHESLARALGVSKVLARQRRCRMTKALRRLGRMARRLGEATRGRAKKKPCHVWPCSMSLSE